jgi:hypothetical protein
MPMKILPLDEVAVNAFLATPGIKISTKHPFSEGEKAGELTTIKASIAIFYETSADDQAAKDRALVEQNDQMDKLIEIAREVAKDKNYNILKNIAQREIYLFTQYNLSKSDAGTVQTLLTPEMRPVLTGA